MAFPSGFIKAKVKRRFKKKEGNEKDEEGELGT